MSTKRGRRYVCTFTCGRSSVPGSKRSDTPEFVEGQVYLCTEEGYLTNDFGDRVPISDRGLKLFFKQYRKPKEISVVNESLFDDDEMTRYGFISHMEHFIKQLLKDPSKAKVDDYLEKHGIDGPKAVKMLIMKSDPNDENSAVLIRKERIEDCGRDENGNRLKDKFHIKYTLPRKDYDKKMKKLYIKMFENYECNNPMLNEEGDAMGSTTTFGDAGDNGSGQFVVPAFAKKKNDTDVIKKQESIYTPKTLQITEEQLNMLKEMGTSDAGNYQYDVPFNGDDETLNHKRMLDPSNPDNHAEWHVNEEGIHIKEKNKGKFNATKKKTGKSTEELTHSKNPLTRKRAQFALNAAKWNHKKK